MHRLLLVSSLSLLGCGNSISDPCPGQRTCPGGSCCDEQYPYNCGDKCYTAPCGPTEVTCIHVDRTDGCYGGKWTGTLTGTGAPGSTVTFDILNKAITATAPAAGSGSIDCDTGMGIWVTTGNPKYTFQGTFMHTESQGDRISNATWSAAGVAGNGTWDALRIE